MLLIVIDLLCTAALIWADRAIKAWAVAELLPVGSMPFIPHILELRFVVNEGMAFSLLSGKQTFLIVCTGAMLLWVSYMLFFKAHNHLERAALVLILSGGIGNLIDRVSTGRVVDYINVLFMRFAVFNFADICVCVGVGLWILYMFLDELHPSVAAESEKKADGTD